MYLQQDALTDFLTADTDQDRFASISELIGTGRTSEFQAALERSRNAWSRTTNQRISVMEEMEERLSRLERQLRELVDASSTPAVSEEVWATWWARLVD